MRQQVRAVPIYLAMSLAAAAAIMSVPQTPPDINGALLWLLTTQAAALDGPQTNAEAPTQFASP